MIYKTSDYSINYSNGDHDFLLLFLSLLSLLFRLPPTTSRVSVSLSSMVVAPSTFSSWSALPFSVGSSSATNLLLAALLLPFFCLLLFFFPATSSTPSTLLTSSFCELLTVLVFFCSTDSSFPVSSSGLFSSRLPTLFSSYFAYCFSRVYLFCSCVLPCLRFLQPSYPFVWFNMLLLLDVYLSCVFFFSRVWPASVNFHLVNFLSTKTRWLFLRVRNSWIVR